MRLTGREHRALRLIREAERAEDGASAVVDATYQAGTTALVHWRTVASLFRKGLVEVESYDAKWDDVTLTDAGRVLADA